MPININVKTKIRFNGQEYDGIESMPPEVRAEFDKIMAGAGKSGGTMVIRSSGKVTFNGQEYESVEAMPEAVRALYQQVLGAVDKDGNGVPDVLEGGTSGIVLPAQPDETLLESAPLISESHPPAEKRVTSSGILLGIMLAILGLVALVFLIVQFTLR